MTHFYVSSKKQVFFILLTLFGTHFLNAQAPQAIPYQAAARNSNGSIIPNKLIQLRFTVHDLSTTGNIVYQETQTTATNAIGMFVVNVGQGNVIGSNTFSGISWANGNKFIQVELDTSAKGTSFVDMGTQQMLSVPFSLFANNANAAINATNAVNSQNATNATNSLNAQYASNGVPVGSVLAFMGNNAPSGWLICDGNAYSRSVYSSLFSVLGTSSGSGNGSSTFNVPDLRGKFLRGVDGGTGNDPDANIRVSNVSGGNIGNNVGSYQNDLFGSHNHFQFVNSFFSLGVPNQSLTTTSPAYNARVATSTGQYSYTITPDEYNSNATILPGGRTGGNETRPKNVYVNYIIKY